MTFLKRTLGLTMLLALGKLFNTPHVGAAVVAGADTVQLPALVSGQSQGSVMQLARKEKNFCPINTYLLRSAETKNFAVQICSTEGGTFSYVGLDKNSFKSITLPARSLSSAFNRFVAVNGDITYQGRSGA